MASGTRRLREGREYETNPQFFHFVLQMTGRHIVGTNGCRIQLLMPVLRERDAASTRQDTHVPAPRSPHQYLSTDDDILEGWPIGSDSAHMDMRPSSASSTPSVTGFGDEGSLSDVILTPPASRRNTDPLHGDKGSLSDNDGRLQYINTREHALVFGAGKEGLEWRSGSAWPGMFAKQNTLGALFACCYDKRLRTRACEERLNMLLIQYQASLCSLHMPESDSSF
jgi:hypothetical protein